MTRQSDVTGTRIGMWLFLYTEIILFGGLFVLYAVYFYDYRNDFIQNGKELNRLIGALNTIILLTSSFTVASSITAIQTGAKKLAIFLLSISLCCGGVFLANKYLEWGHKFALGIYPNSPTLVNGPHGKNIFFGMYYVITGLHGIHVVIGMTLLMVSLLFICTNKITPNNYVVLENAGLYWHLVDLIWIFVFPLFYLIL